MDRQDRPTESGFYWLHINGRWTIGEIDEHGEGYLVGSDEYRGHENDNLWEIVDRWIRVEETM